MLHLTKSAFIEFDHSGLVITCSPAAAELLGFGPASLIGRDYWALTAPGQKQRELNHLMRQPGVSFEKEFLTASGAPVTVRIRGEHDDRRSVVMFETADVGAQGSKEAVERNLRKQNALLLELGRSPALDSGDLEAALRAITETASAGIGCSRSSVWLYAENETRIDCLDLFQANEKAHAGKGVSLFSRDFPGYFEALRADRTISCDDAHTHPATREFSEVYLRPLGIASMLEAPIRHQGKLIGVLCNEHQGPIRSFTQEEQNFAASVADFVSRALEASARLKFENELKAANAELEQRVTQRTAELARRTADMQRVFDTVAQGFVTVDRKGLLSRERSRILEVWFGTPRSDDTFATWLGRADPAFGAWFPECLAALDEGLLPVEVLVDQLPRQLSSGTTTFRLSYEPLLVGEALDGVLAIVTDVTDELERQRAERDQQELMALFTRVLADKPGVMGFVQELDGLVKALGAARGRELPDGARTVHTIKGNAALFQLPSLVECCHRIESAMAEEDRGPSESEAESLRERWTQLKAKVETLLGSDARRRLELDRAE